MLKFSINFRSRENPLSSIEAVLKRRLTRRKRSRHSHKNRTRRTAALWLVAICFKFSQTPKSTSKTFDTRKFLIYSNRHQSTRRNLLINQIFIFFPPFSTPTTKKERFTKTSKSSWFSSPIILVVFLLLQKSSIVFTCLRGCKRLERVKNHRTKATKEELIERDVMVH